MAQRSDYNHRMWEIYAGIRLVNLPNFYNIVSYLCRIKLKIRWI